MKSLLAAELDSSEDPIAIQIGPEIPERFYDVINAHEAVLSDSYAVVVDFVAKHPSQHARDLTQVLGIKVLPFVRESGRVDEVFPGS